MQIKAIIIAVAILAVISTLGGIYASFKLDMNRLKQENAELKESNNVLTSKLAVETLNVEKLKNTITTVNNEIEKMSIRNNTIQNELDKWKKGQFSVANINNASLSSLLDNKLYMNSNCQNGLIINKLISEVEYEDL